MLREQYRLNIIDTILDIHGPGETLERPSVALPALFTVEYALARMWQDRGVRPTAMIGHSAGEYTAACIAGVFTLEVAAKIVGRDHEIETIMATLSAGKHIILEGAPGTTKSTILRAITKVRDIPFYLRYD